MKKTIILFLVTILCGCNNQNKEPIVEPIEYLTVIIDSCEYLQYSADLKYALAYTTHDYQAQFLIHKGNCKYCKYYTSNK